MGNTSGSSQQHQRQLQTTRAAAGDDARGKNTDVHFHMCSLQESPRSPQRSDAFPPCLPAPPLPGLAQHCPGDVAGGRTPNVAVVSSQGGGGDGDGGGEGGGSGGAPPALAWLYSADHGDSVP